MQIRLMLFTNTAEIGNDSSFARNYNFTCEITKLLRQRVLQLSAKKACRLLQLSTSQIEASTSPLGQPPWHLNFWRLACSNSLPSRQKSRSNAPPISTEIPLLKRNFLFNQTLFTLFRERYAVTTPSNWWRDDTFQTKTVLRGLFTNKGEILSWKSEKTAKTAKTHGHISLEQEVNLVQFSHPSKATFKFPPPVAQCTVKCPEFARGVGMLKLQFDRYVKKDVFFPGNFANFRRNIGILIDNLHGTISNRFEQLARYSSQISLRRFLCRVLLKSENRACTTKENNQSCTGRN